MRLTKSITWYIRKTTGALAFLLCTCLSAPSQTLNGDATAIGNGCIELTADSPWQVGSVFFPDTLNLNRPFNILMDLNFGIRDLGGADGIVFVLQNNSATQLGPAGGSMGWQNMPNSLGIEFDTYQNTPEADPGFDHVAIMQNGALNHNGAGNLAGPVSMHFNAINIEDGMDHLAQISWNPANYTLRVYFDCSLRLSLTIDPVNTIFGGDSLVFWGLTAASGGSFNRHTVCFPQGMSGRSDTVSICASDTSTLFSTPSQNGVYSWSPGYNASGTTQQAILIWPTQDTMYTVSYIDSCGFPAVDSYFVQLSNLTQPVLGADTSLCAGNALLLDPGVSTGMVQWNTGHTGPTLLVDSTGMYQVTVSDTTGCARSDSQFVEFIALPQVSLGPDVNVCLPANSHTLTAGPVQPNVTYSWSTGDSGTALTVTNSGSYDVLAENMCGQARDTVLVTFLFDSLIVDLGNDTLHCAAVPFVLDPAVPGGSYLWSTGSTADTLLVTASGWYGVEVVDTNGCRVHDSLQVTLVDPPMVATDPDTTVCGADFEVALQAVPVMPHTSYLWSTGDTTMTITATSAGAFVISATNACGTVRDTVNIVQFPHEPGYFIPNVFSPNGDGINDAFLVENFRPEEYLLRIFDRWGRLVFETSNNEAAWDGQASGKPAPEGTYYYSIRTRDCRGYLIYEKGHLSLFR